MTYDYNLFVIGAGSGGVRAARVSASHGAKVAVAEEHRVGGTCVIRGCVPKKLLVYAAQFAADLRDARRFGWDAAGGRLDWTRLRYNVLAEVDRLNRAYAETLNRHSVDIVSQRAVVSGPNEVTLARRAARDRPPYPDRHGGDAAPPGFPGHDHSTTSNEV